MLNQQSPAKIILQNNGTEIVSSGYWVTGNIANVANKEFNYLKYAAAPNIVINTQDIKRMDTAGALLFYKLITELKKAGKKLKIVGLTKEYQTLYDLVTKEKKAIETLPAPPAPGFVYQLGKHTVEKGKQASDFLAFYGEFSIEVMHVLLHPSKIQWRSFLKIIDVTGYRALPIIGLLLFLIGIVISYQTGLQLRTYGANIYIVSLTGVAVLQEFGPLITAIILAGRTGAAFTSQIGSMKVNQEIDALSTMGLSPINMLVIPRFFGLLVALPLLTVWADVFGIMGSMIMAKHVLGFNYYDYLNRFPRDIKFTTYLIGMSKTPVYAMIIATVGCFQGFEVGTSAESVGVHTTKSVVQSIFLIIIADAIFSVVFGW